MKVISWKELIGTELGEVSQGYIFGLKQFIRNMLKFHNTVFTILMSTQSAQA